MEMQFSLSHYSYGSKCMVYVLVSQITAVQVSPIYLVNRSRSNASDIHLKAETKAAIIAFSSCSYT